jgi:hypothetical protein
VENKLLKVTGIKKEEEKWKVTRDLQRFCSMTEWFLKLKKSEVSSRRDVAINSCSIGADIE